MCVSVHVCVCACGARRRKKQCDRPHIHLVVLGDGSSGVVRLLHLAPPRDESRNRLARFSEQILDAPRTPGISSLSNFLAFRSETCPDARHREAEPISLRTRSTESKTGLAAVEAGPPRAVARARSRAPNCVTRAGRKTDRPTDEWATELLKSMTDGATDLCDRQSVRPAGEICHVYSLMGPILPEKYCDK